MIALALNFVALGVSRMRAVINAVAFQGVVLGLLPLFDPSSESTSISSLLAVAAIALKGLVIPGLLFRAMREVNIQREVEPLVGFIPSLLLGAVGTGLALVFARTLPLAHRARGVR